MIVIKLSLLKNDKRTTCINYCLMHNYFDYYSAQSDFLFSFKQFKIKIVIEIIEIRSTFAQGCKVLKVHSEDGRSRV